MAALEEVRDGEPAALHVVDAHAREVRAVGIQEDDGDLQIGEHLESFGGIAERGDENAAYALLGELPDVARLPVHVLIGAAQHEQVVVLREPIFDAPDDACVERVRQVEHDDADRERMAGPELSGRGVADEPELGHRVEDALPRRLGHEIGSVEDIGHSAHGDTRDPRDVLDAGSVSTHS